jgi:integrase
LTSLPRLKRDKARKLVLAVFRQGGRPVSRLVCTFAEAHFDQEGQPLPDWSVDRRAKFLDACLRAAEERFAAEAVAAAPEGPLFADVWQDWIDYAKATRAEGTVTNYEGTGHHLLEAWGKDLRLNDLSARHVERFIVWLDKRKLSPFGKNLHLNGLKAFFRWAAEPGRAYLTDPPKVKLVKLPAPAPKIADPEEVERMVRHLERQRTLSLREADAEDPDTGERESALRRVRRAGHLLRTILLIRATGMRIGEVIVLPLARLDLDEGVVRVARSKNRNATGIPLAPWFLAWLKTELAGVPAKEKFYLDSGAGKRAFRESSAIVQFNRRERIVAGAPNFSFHDLRDLVATEMLERGVSLQTVSEILGHTDVRTTATHYAGRGSDQKRSAAETVGAPQGYGLEAPRAKRLAKGAGRRGRS